MPNRTEVIRYRGLLVLSLAMWVLGWLAIYDLYSTAGLLGSRPQGILGGVIWAAGVCCCVVVGPISTFRYSLVIRLYEETLHIERAFGLLNTKFDLKDLQQAEYGIEKSGLPEKVNLLFCNGRRVTIATSAHNFGALWDLLRKRSLV